MKEALNFLVAFGGIVIIAFACVITGVYVVNTTSKSTRDTTVIIYHKMPAVRDTITYDTVYTDAMLMPEDTMCTPMENTFFQEYHYEHK